MMTANRTSLYLVMSKESLRINRTARNNMITNMTFPNNASPITSLQLKIVEKTLLEEAPPTLFTFEKDNLTYIVMDCLS